MIQIMMKMINQFKNQKYLEVLVEMQIVKSEDD